jgi:hypothetical protein
VYGVIGGRRKTPTPSPSEVAMTVPRVERLYDDPAERLQRELTWALQQTPIVKTVASSIARTPTDMSK